MKDFINGAGSMFSLVLLICFILGVLYIYPDAEPELFSAEMNARMDDLISNLTPLFVADLGEMK